MEPVTGTSKLNKRFVLQERLDQGPFGTMYHAIDTERSDHSPAHRVVLWLLPDEFVQNRPALEIFRRDFARVREIAHPNVARVYELNHDGDVYFMTSEQLDGETLRDVLDHLRPERLDSSEADEIVEAVGDALMHAHECGVIHGDVRPENLVITTRHEVKLLSFMTTSFMRSGPVELAPADDARALAAMAYELYTGEPIPRGGDLRRIRGLSKRRWKAIRRALLRSSRERNFSVGDFLADAGLGATSWSPRAMITPGPSPFRHTRHRPSWAVVAPIAGAAGLAVYFFATGQVGTLLGVTGLRDWAPGNPLPADSPAASNTATEETVDAAAASNPSEPAEGEAEASMENSVEDVTDRELTATAEAEIALERGREQSVAIDSSAAAMARPMPIVSSETETSEAALRGVAEPSESGGADEIDQAASLSLSVGSSVVPEGESMHSIDILRTGDISEALEFAWWTRDGTARDGDDYASFGTRIDRFAPGESVRTLQIPITSDESPEDDEYFFVHIEPSSNGAGVDTATITAEVRIVDDDS